MFTILYAIMYSLYCIDYTVHVACIVYTSYTMRQIQLLVKNSIFTLYRFTVSHEHANYFNFKIHPVVLHPNTIPEMNLRLILLLLFYLTE